MAKLGAAPNVLHESHVEANNWMSALRATREALSERPSVPPGASCSIDAQGVATVLDPGSRRKFVLEPVEAIGAASPAVRPTADTAPAQAPAAAAAQPPKRFETVPRVPNEAAAPATPVLVGPAVVAAPPPSAAKPQPAADAPIQQPAAAEVGAAKKKRFDTVAFADARPAPLGSVQAAATAPTATPQGKAAAPVAVVNRAAPAPAPASALRSAAAQAPAVATSARPASDDVPVSLKPNSELELLLTRDDDPTAENPLCYRERAYLLPRGATVPEAEAALRWKLADLQKSIQERPRGKLVHLAVFDHRWQDIPERPPVIALEWRDWRGDVAVDYPAATRVSSLPPPSRPNDDHLPEVFEALGELSRLHTPAEGLDFAVRLLGRTIPSQAISACLYDINTDELRFVALAGTNAELMQGHAVPRAAGLFGIAARAEGQATVFADVLVEPAFDPEVDSRPGLEARNMLLRPLSHERQLMGMLQLVNRGGAGTFSTQDVNAINYVAERLAEFLHGTRLQSRTPA